MNTEANGNTVTPVTQPYRILKIATAPSLSAKSTLTYHVGCTPENEIAIRIFDNSGAGMYSKEWVKLDAINDALAKAPDGEAVTAFLLFPLYASKSVNTPSFLFAVLAHEGIVEPSKKHKRRYDRLGDDKFVAAMRKLMESDVDLKPDTPAPTNKPRKANAQAAKTDAKAPKPEAKATKPAEKSKAAAKGKPVAIEVPSEEKSKPAEAKPVAIEVPSFISPPAPAGFSNLEPAMPRKKAKAKART